MAKGKAKRMGHCLRVMSMPWFGSKTWTISVGMRGDKYGWMWSEPYTKKPSAVRAARRWAKALSLEVEVKG